MPNKVFGTGGSRITSTLRRLSVAIANDATGAAAERTSVFYTDPNGCDGYAEFLSGTTTLPFKYWVAGTAAADTDKICEARIGGQPLDFAYMPHDLSFCGNQSLPAGVGDFRAPVQSVSVVTGLLSTESAISAEALHLIYGWGHAGQVAPWTLGSGIFDGGGFARQLLGAAIRLPPDRFQSNDQQSGAGPITRLQTYAGTEQEKHNQALLFTSTSVADTRRADVKTLAYQHFDQTCGVLPDSSASSFDKRNVRVGKYFLWSAGHFFARSDGGGGPTNARLREFLGWFDGSSEPRGTNVDALAEVIRAGEIPDCAMQVTREATLGAFASYVPPKPCGCYFEATANGASGCSACTDDSDCSAAAAPSCNFGYCEAYRDAAATEG